MDPVATISELRIASLFLHLLVCVAAITLSTASYATYRNSKFPAYHHFSIAFSLLTLASSVIFFTTLGDDSRHAKTLTVWRRLFSLGSHACLLVGISVVIVGYKNLVGSRMLSLYTSAAAASGIALVCFMTSVIFQTLLSSPKSATVCAISAHAILAFEGLALLTLNLCMSKQPLKTKCKSLQVHDDKSDELRLKALVSLPLVMFVTNLISRIGKLVVSSDYPMLLHLHCWILTTTLLLIGTLSLLSFKTKK